MAADSDVAKMIADRFSGGGEEAAPESPAEPVPEAATDPVEAAMSDMMAAVTAGDAAGAAAAFRMAFQAMEMQEAPEMLGEE